MNKRIECPGQQQSFHIVNRHIPQAPPRGLVIKNHYTGLCHSDLHMWEMQLTQFFPGFKYPAIYGHEMAGEVYSLGPQYKGELAVGDVVIVHPFHGCEECPPCKSGDFLMCTDMFVHHLGGGTEGGFQHYTPIEQGQHVLKVPGSIPLEVVCTMGCSGIATFRAVRKLIPVAERAIRNFGVAKVLVIGAGGLGMWAIQWVKALLPPQTKLFVADISEKKIQGGLDQGADEGILWDRTASDEALVKLTMEKTGGGVDGTLDFVGIPETSGRAVACSNKGGMCVIVGLGGEKMTMATIPLVTKSIRVEGSCIGDIEDLKDVMQHYVDKKVKSPPLMLVKPEDTERCLADLRALKFQGRYIIDWTKE